MGTNITISVPTGTLKCSNPAPRTEVVNFYEQAPAQPQVCTHAGIADHHLTHYLSRSINRLFADVFSSVFTRQLRAAVFI